MTPQEYMASFKARHAEPKKRRKSARQQVREERERLKAEILEALANKQRCIPKDWERGYNAARSAIEEVLK